MVQCSDSRDFYIVMDTSGSMSSGTMDRVRASIPQITNLLKEGDRVLLVSFDESAQLDKTIEIKKDADKKAIQSWVEGLKAKGRFTDMRTMLTSLKSIQAKNTPADRQSYLIVLSDGKDDPGPGKTEAPVKLQDFQDPNAPQGPRESFVYYISLGKEKSKALESGLKEISPSVKTVETGKPSATNQKPGGEPGAQQVVDNGAIDLGPATSDIESRSTGFWGNLWDQIVANWKWIAIGLGILLLLLLLWFWRWRAKKAHVLQGQLKFWEEGTHPDLGKVVRLSKLQGKKLTIGSKPGNKIRIKDMSADRISLKGTTKRGAPVLKPSKIKALEFENQKRKGLISPGDTFKLGNYNFEYKDGNEKG